MSLDPTGGNLSWNYSNPQKDGYSVQLIGTVLAIQEVQKRGYNPSGQPGAPQFWPDGNPQMNIRMALALEDGSIKSFTFQPAGKAAKAGQKRSIHLDLFALTGNTSMTNLIGKTICIQTQEGHYGQGNPRPWFVQLVEAGPFEPSVPLPEEYKVPRLLANTAASGGQVTPPAPQPQYQQQPQYAPQPMPQQPAYPQQYQQPMYPQPASQPQYAQPAPQPVVQQMDPNVMAAMASQAFGGEVQVQQYQTAQPDPVGTGEVYSDIPF